MTIPILNQQTQFFKTLCPLCMTQRTFFIAPQVRGLANCMGCGAVFVIDVLARNEKQVQETIAEIEKQKESGQPKLETPEITRQNNPN